MRPIILAAPVVLMLAAGACNRSSQQPTETLSAASEEVAPTEAPAPAPDPAPMIWFDPSAASTCSKEPIKVTVHWNARPVEEVSSVEVRPIGPGGRESLFVHGGPLGHRETGAWMTPGRQMVLRDHANGKELGRAKLEGIPCTGPSPDATGEASG